MCESFIHSLIQCTLSSCSVPSPNTDTDADQVPFWSPGVHSLTFTAWTQAASGGTESGRDDGCPSSQHHRRTGNGAPVPSPGVGENPASSENTRQALGTAPHAVSPPQMGGTLFIRDPCFSASALAGYSGVGSGDAGDPGAITVASQAPQQDGGRIRFGHRQRSRVDTAGLPQATLPPSASPQCPQLWATGLSPWPGTFHPRREGWDAPYWPTGTQVTKKLSLQTYSSSSSWGDRWVHCSIPQTWRTRHSARPWNRKEGHCPCPRPRPDSL